MTDTAAARPDADLDRDLARLLGSDPDAMVDPYPLWARLREEAPVHTFSNAILFSRNHSVRKLINDPRAAHGAYGRGKRAAAIRAGHSPAGQKAFDEVAAFEALYLSRTDGEAHARLRRIVQRTFTARRIRQIEALIQSTTTAYIDALAGEATADIMPFAYGLPLRIIGGMLGVPDEDLEMVHAWSSKLGRNRGGLEEPALLEAHAALLKFRAYVEAMIERLRAAPPQEDGLSLITDLLGANAGDALSDAELCAMFVVLLFAGHETTTNLIGTGLFSLLQQRDQWERLCADPELVRPAVEELVRHVSPVQYLGRHIVEPIEAEGVRLEAGDSVLLMIAAANRDPEVFEDPEQLNIERQDGQFHLGFGMGAHVCLGSHLARMEAISAFATLSARYPDVTLARSDLTWRGNAKLRGLTALPLNLGRDRAP